MVTYRHDPGNSFGLCHHFFDPRIGLDQKNRDHRAQVFNWCTAEFGRENLHGKWFITGRMVWIRDLTDATAFRLKWC